jgi:large subunit ribosomal protein L35
MPKMKTHKGTKKRFRLTATGQAKHRQAGTSHLAARMSKKRRRNLRGTKVLDKPMLYQIHRALAPIM